MVSAQIPGQYALYIQAPSGNKRLVKSAAAGWFGPGGSSNGVIANTPEKWNYLAPSADVGGPGYSIVVTSTTGAATTDASDAVWIIPVIVNGQAQTVGNDQAAGGMGNLNFVVDQANADKTVVANNETVMAIYRAKEGVNFRIGGDRVFVTVEDNA